MKENRKYNYEGMFLLRQTAAADLGAAVEHIRELLTRAEGEIIAMKKWDERRLAYEIKKQKRGMYILVYVTLPTTSMANLERTLNLSDMILRWMLVRADHLTLDEMRAADAQQELADEIKLRADRARERADRGEAIEEEQEEVSEETETASADM